ncbi:MAG TPA: YfjI family protein, partial [Gammaproteobacteria bacterium]|nr:YfjI family protein [Gammaproteobacteria bacterium]
MNTPSLRPPQPDATLIAAALNALFESDDVIELRALLSKQRRRTDVGYFDGKHREQLIQEAVRLNNAGAAVYVTLNRLDPQLLARCANRVQQGAQTSAADADVTRRRWLLLDFDPIRPKDTSSTGEQLKAAKDCARACYQALKAEGWPEPVVAESGNGMHLLYPLDMPSDNESRDLIKGTLAGLAQRFDTERVTLDRTVFNAGRIIKLYGTVANKGDHTLTAPWRLSRLVSTPVRGPVVTVDQLRALHPVIDTSSTATRVGAFPRLDLEEFLSRLGIAYTHDMHEGSERFKLDHCPFNADHGKGEAAIFRSADGVSGFKCQHNSCAEYHWQDVRALVDGPREARTKLLAPAPSLSSALPNQAHRGNSRCRADEESWPQPQPLIIAADMAPYPLHALPEGIREAVREVVGFVQCPVSLAACSALSALSLTCQALADVRRADKLAGPCSLYLLAVAESGERKTTCDSLFALSIREWEQEQTGRMQPELSRHTAALNAWTAKYQGVSQAIKHAATSSKLTFDKEGELERLEADKPQAPRVPSLIYGDTTPEALAFNLAQEWPSGGVLSSEAGIVFGGHGTGRDSIMRNLALLNSLWDGIRHKVHRRTSDSFTVQDVRLTMGLAVQPDTVRTFFENSKGLARGSGFAARFLIAWPESTQG